MKLFSSQQLRLTQWTLIISIVFVCFIPYILSTSTESMSKTEGKTSIFSYDFLSIMKKKMQMMKNKAGANTGMNASVKASAKANSAKANSAKASAKTYTTVKSNTQSHKEDAETSNSEEQEEDILPEINLGDGPTFYQGWVKYFKYRDGGETHDKPNAFFKNNYFFEQPKYYPDADLTKKAADGQYEFIPSETHFWCTLFKESLNLSGNRDKHSQATSFDTLSLGQIMPVVEGKGFQGGIIDFGAFSEGACFKLALKSHRTWILCTDTPEEKLKLMTALKNIKLFKQREKGQFFTVEENNKEEDSLENVMGEQKHAQDTPQDPKAAVDGHWVLLQDWSQCSKKCDKGVSTLHRMCIPPKNGGKPCEGEAILTRPCNDHPCPVIPGSEEGSANANSTAIQKAAAPVTLKPIVKVMPFSNKPQRYRRCVIKESDLMMTRSLDSLDSDLAESHGHRPIQVPVRAIMNNRTLSFYENAEDYNSQFITFNLLRSDFSRSQKNKRCFIISQNKKHAELCSFTQTKNDHTFEEWDEAFHIFKYQCATKPETFEPEMEEELQDKLQDKMKQAKKQLLLEQEKEVKRRVQERDEEAANKEIKQTTQVAQEAIIKEESLEEMIEKEEEEREIKEEKFIEEEIESEKKKNDCVMNAIKERELETEYQLKNKEREKEVEVIKKKAMEEVEKKRNKLKMKIAEMRKKAKSKENKLKSKLMSIRMSMAKEMTNVYKDGDSGKCMQAMKSEEYRKNYCTANFEDYIKFSQCKENDDFCILCCENEFGEMHMDKRNACIKELCEPKEEEEEKVTGRWIWANNVHDEDGQAKRK